MKNPVDIPPAQPVPPAQNPMAIVVAPPVNPPINPPVVPQPKPPVNPPPSSNPPTSPPISPSAPPEEPSDWKVTNINVLNVGKWYGKVIFIVNFRDGKNKTDERIQGPDKERILNQPSSPGYDNPIKEIIVKTYWLKDECYMFGSDPECWYEVGTRTVQPAGSEQDKYVCFEYGKIETPAGFSVSIMGHESTRCDGRKWRY